MNDKEKLPQSLKGIDPGYTRGLSPSDYVNRRGHAPCHPACECREKKVEELVEAVVRGCDHQLNCQALTFGRECSCYYGPIEIAIEGVTG